MTTNLYLGPKLRMSGAVATPPLTCLHAVNKEILLCICLKQESLIFLATVRQMTHNTRIEDALCLPTLDADIMSSL